VEMKVKLPKTEGKSLVRKRNKQTVESILEESGKRRT